jgi:hypothetical protein
MQISARQSGGEIVLTITADNASDRAILGLFDDQNNKGVTRRIACNSTYDAKYSAVTELHLSGLDVKPPATPPMLLPLKWIGLKR